MSNVFWALMPLTMVICYQIYANLSLETEKIKAQAKGLEYLINKCDNKHCRDCAKMIKNFNNDHREKE